MMTVSDLIKQLQEIEVNGGGDHRVIVKGYEGGYDDVDSVSEMKIALNVNSDWYYGDHESVDSLRDYHNHEGIVPAIYIQ